MPAPARSAWKKRKFSAELSASAASSSNSNASASGHEALTTQLQTHRCRFVDWMPQAVDALSFSRAGDRLAVARASGDVELWRLGGSASRRRGWSLALVVRGSRQRRVSALAWAAAGRLFAASLDGTLWEVDLLRGARTHVTDAAGGPVWCLAIDDATQALAAGCEDGRVRLFSFADGALHLARSFVATGARVVSIAWHSAHRKLFSGGEDGVIHCWNAASGRNEARITLETIAKQKTVVWALAVLDDLTLVSGDSSGAVSFWHAPTGTLLQKFTHHTADVLALAVDPANATLFASGVDNQVVQFRRRAQPDASQWAYAYTHRAHSHDVRALAMSPSADFSVLVSGGIDTQLVWYFANRFNVDRPKKIASAPYRGSISLARDARVLLVQKSTSLDLWKLASDSTRTPVGVDLATSTANMLLLQLNVSEAFNLSCSAVASDASFIACSTAQELKLFALKAQTTASGELSALTPRKIKLPGALASPARALAFSPDSTRLVIASESHQIRVLDVAKMEIIKTFRIHPIDDSEAAPIASISVSQDGQWLATADVENRVSVYNLDSMQFFCNLPRPDESISGLTFSPSGKILVVTLESNKFVIYDVEQKGLTDWHREHHERYSTALKDCRCLKGAAFDPANADMLYLYCSSRMYQVNMGKQPSAAPQPKRPRAESVGAESDGKKSEDEVDTAFCRVVTKFSPLSFMDFVAEGELVVVETPWLKVLSRLPGSLHRHKYGK